MRFILAALGVCFAFAAWAETPVMSAPEAKDLMARGEIVVLDIRTEQEWAETGIAEGAWPVSMHRPDFGSKLQAILSKYGPENVALICATGGRTAHVAKILERNGIQGVSDISESMLGNRRGPGWVARGFSVVSPKVAQQMYDDAIKTN